jgi:SulP family sulfate permease
VGDFKQGVSEYFRDCFLSDLRAGFITAIVALPLAIAFAVASGVAPIMGLYTAIIAGTLASLFGGSKYSITGPTGAMTVVVLSTLNKWGLEGLMLAGFLAGAMQLTFGAIKMGKLIKFIPLPIVSGFTAGIGIIIFIGQIPNALGLILPAKEHIWETLAAVIGTANSVNPYAVLVTIGTVAVLMFFPKIFSKTLHIKSVPPSIVALVFFTTAIYFSGAVVPEIGEIPSGLPTVSLIKFDIELLTAVLPAALTIALLGIIESLLCAVVCDGMTNTRHDSDKELVAQGLCNIVIPFFGGIPATGAIARSAVNIREGAKTRYAGVIHALFLLLIVLFLAPLVRYIPSAFLAGILMSVAYRMVNLEEILTIRKISRAESTVLFITMGLTIFTDLVFAVQAGMILAVCLIFIKFSNMVDISPMADYDANAGINKRIYSDPRLKNRVSVYTLQGPLFFGAMSIFDRKVSEHIDTKMPMVILRMKHVPFIDSTAITRLNSFISSRHRQGCVVLISGLLPEVADSLKKDHEFCSIMPDEHLFERTNDAIEHIKKELDKTA